MKNHSKTVQGSKYQTHARAPYYVRWRCFTSPSCSWHGGGIDDVAVDAETVLGRELLGRTRPRRKAPLPPFRRAAVSVALAHAQTAVSLAHDTID
jgi:hypothetical protein